jgi:hypothetical protein
LKGKLSGRRYKWIIWYDYELCEKWYEEGDKNNSNKKENKMKWIIKRYDFDIYYGGEEINVEKKKELKCKYCGKMGFNEKKIKENVK